jgi:CubicO group peptidase (beta-lactamase class C family)
MEHEAATRPTTKRQWAWAWVVGLIGLVAAVTIVAILATKKPKASVRARSVRSPSRAFLFSPANLDSASGELQRAVSDRVVPGAALAIGARARTVELVGYGRIGWSEKDEAVSPDSTRYDLASLTKAVATTTATLLLIQDGRIRLDDPVQRWLPEFKGRWKERVTWRHLLTHTAGLPVGTKVRGGSSSQRLHNVILTELDEPPGRTVSYSDVGFIILWKAVESAAGEPLPALLERRVWRPLGMRSTSFWPGAACDDCAPTLSQSLKYRGKPSDPVSRKIGVPTGNAGLFSTAHDLARFAAMIANGGTLGGVRILRPDLVRELFAQQPHAGHRTLGWNAFCPGEDPTQQQACVHPIAYGHTGWTGTSLWIDPVRGVWVVILSNRSYDVKRPPSLDELREDIFLDAAGLDGGVADSTNQGDSARDRARHGR